MFSPAGISRVVFFFLFLHTDGLGNTRYIFLFSLTLRENSDPVSHKALFSVPPWSQHLAMEHLGPATHPSLRSITCPAGRKPMMKKEDSRPWLQRNDEMRRNPLRGKSTVGLKQTLGEQWVRGADDNGCRHAVPGATSWRTILRYAMSITPWGCVTWGTLGRPPDGIF